MVTIGRIARYVLFADDLRLRLMVENFLRSTPVLSTVPRPGTGDVRVLAVAAGLLEMFAQRMGQEPPAWTREVGAALEPIFLNSDALNSNWLKQLCQDEAPEPLKKRRLYAVSNFLASV